MTLNERLNKLLEADIYDWIAKNQSKIDAHIKKKVPNTGKIDDRERRLWVLNDYELYTAAQNDGVDFEA